MKLETLVGFSFLVHPVASFPAGAFNFRVNLRTTSPLFETYLRIRTRNLIKTRFNKFCQSETQKRKHECHFTRYFPDTSDATRNVRPSRLSSLKNFEQLDPLDEVTYFGMKFSKVVLYFEYFKRNFQEKTVFFLPLTIISSPKKLLSYSESNLFFW